MKTMRKAGLSAIAATLLCASAPAMAQGNERYLDDLGWGAAAAAVNCFYSPAKLTYAALGGIIGGMAYAWTAGSEEAGYRVWSATLGGTYVITPAMLRGEESVLFVGETYQW